MGPPRGDGRAASAVPTNQRVIDATACHVCHMLTDGLVLRGREGSWCSTIIIMEEARVGSSGWKREALPVQQAMSSPSAAAQLLHGWRGDGQRNQALILWVCLAL